MGTIYSFRMLKEVEEIKRFLDKCRGRVGAGSAEVLSWRRMTGAALFLCLLFLITLDPVSAGAAVPALTFPKKTEMRNTSAASAERGLLSVSSVKATRRISSSGVKLSRTSYRYDGHAKKPSVTVRYCGKKLKRNRDYTVSYKNNKKRGTAKVTVKGRGRYSGTVVKTFRIR